MIARTKGEYASLGKQSQHGHTSAPKSSKRTGSSRSRPSFRRSCSEDFAESDRSRPPPEGTKRKHARNELGESFGVTTAGCGAGGSNNACQPLISQPISVSDNDGRAGAVNEGTRRLAHQHECDSDTLTISHSMNGVRSYRKKKLPVQSSTPLRAVSTFPTAGSYHQYERLASQSQHLAQCCGGEPT